MTYIHKHPFIMIIIGVMGISCSAIFVRYSQAPSSITAAYRLIWTVLLMSPVVLGIKKNRKELLKTNIKTAFICAISGIALAIHFTLWFESLKHTTVASSTVIVCTEVIWVALGFCLFMHGRMSFKEGLAIAIALTGSVCIALTDSAAGSAHLYGDILSLLSAIAVAAYMLLGRLARSSISTTTYTYIVYMFCAAALIIISIVQGIPLIGYGACSIIVGLLLAVFSTILGHSIFSWCLKYFSPAFVSASKLCEPVIAAALAIPLFHEIPKIGQLIGGALILAGVIFYSQLETADKGD